MVGAPDLNPYQGVGKIADGHRYVDRPELLDELRGGWRGDCPGNVSVRGNYRTGKSSLVRHAAMDHAKSHADQVVGIIRAGSVTDGVSLIRQLGKRAYNCLVGIDRWSAVADTCLPPLGAAMEVTDWTDVSEAVAEFFERLARAGVQSLLVIDEFDRLSSWCTTSEYQFLRDLASEPQFSVGLTTVSRRSVYDIEMASAGGSSLGGVMGHTVGVSLMSHDEAVAMMQRASHYGGAVSDYADEIAYLAGAHPFLLEMACFQYFQLLYIDKATDLTRVEPRLRLQFASLYEIYLRNLEAEFPGSVQACASMLTSGSDLAKFVYASRLVDSAMVRVPSDGGLLPFSDHFAAFWRAAGSEISDALS